MKNKMASQVREEKSERSQDSKHSVSPVDDASDAVHTPSDSLPESLCQIVLALISGGNVDHVLGRVFSTFKKKDLLEI